MYWYSFVNFFFLQQVTLEYGENIYQGMYKDTDILVLAVLKLIQTKRNAEKQFFIQLSQHQKCVQFFEEHFLQDLEAELELLCSRNQPSILRDTSADALLTLSANRVMVELQERTPKFLSVLQKSCVSKRMRQNHARTEEDADADGTLLKIISVACCLLKARCKDMLAWATRNSVSLQFGGCSTMVSKLSMKINIKKLIPFFWNLKHLGS